MQHLFLVFVGGGLGAVCRYLSTTSIGAVFGSSFPFGTLFVNTLGSLLMGFIMGILLLIAERTGALLSEPMRLLLTVGFLGGFTTFSSFSLETVTLLHGGSVVLAVLNVLANVVLSLAMAAAGLMLARLLPLS
ncbi:fluoride efflux transporter CrcB [Mitsuokella sp.]|mgnify:FL=1|uniref:fluoride efflux transporter CrcB n=1 Tax=Mitsuokella sp. TaxID=2049034 RepID=UPI002A7EE1CA|nr:fluoride efflux transporter CrcB [Mitsuokella sp.]MDY4474465.1 fluoride efflux transporter CrcB [Mitsuokella sp.]